MWVSNEKCAEYNRSFMKIIFIISPINQISELKYLIAK